MKFINTLLITLSCLFLTNISHANDTKIVVSIKPLHSIVSNVVGSDNIRLLVDKGYSPHDFQLKPSHMKRLQNADIVFYIDDLSLEAFLARPLRTTKKNTIWLSATQ